MKIDIYDIEKVYKKYFEIQQNQIEIYQTLRGAISDYTALDSFQGLTAENAKSYMADVHISVVDSIELALMELEIRLLTLKQDFNATVDESASAVVDEDCIGQTIEDISGFIKEADTHDSDVTSLISSVSDIVSLTAPPIPGYVDLMTTAKANAEETMEKLLDFEKRHKADMDNVNEMFSAVHSAVQYMADTSNIGEYTAQSACEMEWSKTLFTCQINAYIYATETDPDFANTIYVEFAVQTGLTMLDTLIPPDADMSLVMELLEKGSFGTDVQGVGSATKQALDVLQFYREGLRFAAKVDPNTGETIIQAVSLAGKSLTRSQQVVALRAAGIADDLSRATSRSLAQSLFSAKGLQVTGENAYQLKNGALDAKSIAALTKAANAGEDSAGFMKQFAQDLKGASKLDWAMYGVSLGIDAADACYDERTRQFKKIDGVEFASTAVVDTASFLAPIAASTAAGAAWGTAVPGIGNLVGAGVGLVVGAANVIKWGEPPKSVTDHASDWIEGAIHDAGNWLSKVFW